jgi:Uma2 family endonuclease
MDSFASLDLTKSYTYADYLKWTFDEAVELIKGKIFRMSPAPSRYHQRVSNNLFLCIGVFLRKKKCQVYTAPFDVRMKRKGAKDDETFDVVQPDICVICDPSKLDAKGCNGAPDWVVEILSPGNSNKEKRFKFELYQEAGVKEYWIVEPEYKSLEVYVLQGDKFVGLAPYIDEDVVSPTIFPDLKIDLKEVFED